jgi:N-acetylneuraminic acid mutarotase
LGNELSHPFNILQMKKSAVTSFLFLSFCYWSIAQEGSWDTLKTKNTAPECSECGLAAVNGKLYLIGGDGGGPRAVQRFDLITLTWEKLAEAPLLMHHFQAVAYKTKLYVLDAFSDGGFPDQMPMANVYSFDTGKNSWEKGGEIPAARRRAGAGAVEYKGKLYLVAGIQHGHSSGTTNMFDCYDPVTKSWSVLPDAPHIRDHCSAVVIKEKLYVVGGRNTSYRDPENKVPFFAMTMLDVDVYDFAARKWSTLAARLPLGSGGGAVVSVNNVLYYMGGERATETEHNAPRKNVYYLDPATTNQWIETDSLHKARNGMAAAVWNNRIYVAGGSGGGPGGPPPGNPNGGMPPPGQQPNRPPPQGNRPSEPANNQPVAIEVFTLKQGIY